MELVQPGADDVEVEELFEVLPGGGSFNAGNKATHAEFVVSALQHLERAGARVVAGSHHVGPIQVGARASAPTGACGWSSCTARSTTPSRPACAAPTR